MVEQAIIAPDRCRGYIGILRCFVDLLSSHHKRTNTLCFELRNDFGSRTGSTILATTRVVAWIVAIGLIITSIVPAPLRPGTGASHNFEHFGSFLLAGIIWCLAYSGRLLLWLGTMVIFAGSVELLQILVPGRHARFSDFVVDVLGGCAGIFVTFLVVGCYRLCRKDTPDNNWIAIPGPARSLDITGDRFHPEWNYTIKPRQLPKP